MSRDVVEWPQVVLDELLPDKDGEGEDAYHDLTLATLTETGLSIGGQYRRPGEAVWRTWHDEGISITHTAAVRLRDFLNEHLGRGTPGGSG